MIKRLVVGVFVSGLTMFAVAPAATAAASSDSVVVKVAKPTKPTPGKVIDWDAPAPAPSDGGASTQRIDWD